MSTTHRPSVLISGASFAGLSAAWWMHRLGYAVTVVEVAKAIRKGGTPVDIGDPVRDIVRRMGLLDAIAARALPPRPTQFFDGDGVPFAGRPPRYDERQGELPEWEIERDDLLDLLLHSVQGDVEFLFEDSIATLQQTDDAIHVSFTSGLQRSFSLLLGCDGTHSVVRRLFFGEESAYSLFLKHYFSLTIVHRLLLPENTSQMFNVPGRTVMLNAYNGKTDIAFCFHSPDEVIYQRRDRDRQKQFIEQHFTGLGWRVPELLREMHQCENFYFDKLCQIRMPSWTTGRIALVGDAGYCPSPAAGMGGSMAILGAGALADAFLKHPADHRQAFLEYNRSLRPIVEEVQDDAVHVGLKMFAPVTEQDLQQRNTRLHLFGQREA